MLCKVACNRCEDDPKLRDVAVALKLPGFKPMADSTVDKQQTALASPDLEKMRQKVTALPSSQAFLSIYTPDSII
jgi:hypothetical protein